MRFLGQRVSGAGDARGIRDAACVVLGSSDYSAQLAASFGLPYVFANHFAGEGLEGAAPVPRPVRPNASARVRTFVTSNVVAAPPPKRRGTRGAAAAHDGAPAPPTSRSCRSRRSSRRRPTRSTRWPSRSWPRRGTSGSVGTGATCRASSPPSPRSTASTRSWCRPWPGLRRRGGGRQRIQTLELIAQQAASPPESGGRGGCPLTVAESCEVQASGSPLSRPRSQSRARRTRRRCSAAGTGRSRGRARYDRGR